MTDMPSISHIEISRLMIIRYHSPKNITRELINCHQLRNLLGLLYFCIISLQEVSVLWFGIVLSAIAGKDYFEAMLIFDGTNQEILSAKTRLALWISGYKVTTKK